ncbi:metal ABC transporter substrate-binding protein [Paracoccus sp. DMF]|uniref:metal ABC transporter substrate-binding protein n=1 Tax=Paracoccus sp. DMF TaxID=400837 RepID=UPI0021E3D3C1|nr:metal ABC transporter substrate-binding protein [Paracoccus sp. DMF]MCV2447213.1 metal ABC transporter substrate-binding protein [Paracoccus sp. DMF]
MKRLLPALLLALLALPAAAETLLTAHPATEALARRLTFGTAIAVEAVQPEKLPASRLHSYLAGRGRDRLEQAARPADAVLTLGGIWPADPLYPAARRANIRIVEIDATRPLDQRLPGIARLGEGNADAPLYAMLGLEPMPPAGEETAPWLSPTRLGEMAEIVAGDLTRLAPAEAGRIAQNLRGLKHELLQAKAAADQAMAARDSAEAVALSPQFSYLAADLGLELRARIIAAPSEWTPERATKLADWMAAEGIDTALTARDLPEPLAEALAGKGIGVLLLDSAAPGDPAQLIAGNIARLARSGQQN